ncbi:MAG TPA: 5-oxoprolinase subunit PxpB [Vicinamibacterales bacterium]
MIDFTILAAGDAALVVQLDERIDPALNAWCVALSERVRTELGPSLRDTAIGYCSVTVYFNPQIIDSAWLEEEICAIAESIDAPDATHGAIVEVPVCYGGELGPDLTDVARFAGRSEEDVVALHAGREYRVYLVGFIPGFAYMAEVDPAIAAPRRATPRAAVPAGSVAIAGGQTGIYPAVTPGGWNVIGRTPLAPYDPRRPEPFLFRPGDRVRFHRIGEADFQSW